MTYANVTATSGATIVGYPMHFIIATKTAQNDVVNIPDAKGVIPFIVYDMTDAASLSGGTQDWWEYSIIRNNGGSLSTAATTAYDGAVISERQSGDYYVLAPASGEIFYVSADDGSAAVSGTLTIRRGCLGTTAADIADDDYLQVLNCIVLKGPNVGKVLIGYYKLPDDPKANFF